ncbi:hypothetical protein EJB05_36427, partial [Eragrostis curvula]
MSADAMQLPRIDFSGVDPSAPGTGTWSAVRAQVMDALTTTGCFDAHYPALTPEFRAALFDGAVKPLFALPVEAKRRNYYGADKPFHGYMGDIPGFYGYESLAIVDALKSENVRAFADLVWPDGGNGFCETVHSAAKRMAELEETVRLMVLEELGVAKYHEPLKASSWHLFRVAEYEAPNAAEKTVRYGSHQDTNMLSVICQHEVEGLEMRTRDGDWIVVKPRRRRSSSWPATRCGPGQMTICTPHSTGLQLVGMSTDTLPTCSQPRISRFRRLMNSWMTNTLPASSPITMMTSSASVYLKKVLSMKINSRLTVVYRQHTTFSVELNFLSITELSSLSIWH